MLPRLLRRMTASVLLVLTAMNAETGQIRSQPAIPVSRWLVELNGPALVDAPGEVVGSGLLARPAPAARLDVSSESSERYLARLGEQQHRFLDLLANEIPSARLVRQYGVLLNAVAIALPLGDESRLARLPGVRAAYPDRGYVLQDFPDVEQIGGTLQWQRIGGPRRAGAGIKIAIVDSGIYLPNPSFDAAGYEYPAGFPKGDARFTSAKVIAARGYLRPDDPPKPGENTPLPHSGGHGTHVAATAAGDYGILANVDGLRVPVSGVAPGAYLMNYRVFYPSVSESDFVTENAFTVELVAALEDVVRDGADVVSNSWGASYTATYGWPDPMVKALEGVVAAGIVVAQAAGNAGPSGGTLNNPTNAPSVISVGAVTTSSEVAHDFLVAVGAGAPEPTQFSRASFGSKVDRPTNDLPVGTVEATGTGAGCEPIGKSHAGQLVLITRGGCAFVQKARNAQAAGAAAVVFVNDSDDRFEPGGGDAEDVRIPTAMIAKSDGQRLTDWLLAARGVARVRLDPRPAVVQTQADVLAAFSSRGPTTEGLLKPDVVAPGVNILAAGYGPEPNPLAGFGQISGTSMATPHVAGAAALVRQVRPDWSPLQVKSALMTTAQTRVLDRSGKQLGPIERGAGRIDVARAVDAVVLTSPSSLSFGRVQAGSVVTRTVRVSTLAGRAEFRAEARLAGDMADRISTRLVADRLMVGPGEDATVIVTISVGQGVPGVDVDGELVLTGNGATVHLPLWLRVMPDTDRMVLLLDNDGSEDLGLPQTAGIYRQVLEGLGYSYDLFDADERRVGPRGLPPAEVLGRYKLIIYLSGSRDSPAPEGRGVTLSERDQDILAEYLDGGGRLLAAGKSVERATDVNFAFRDPLFGRSRLFHGYLGAVVRGHFAGSIEANGSGPFAGLRVRLAADQDRPMLDAYREDSDTYLAPRTVQSALVGSGGRALGLVRASEPTLEEPRRQFAYRSAVLGFGLEDVVEADRGGILGALIGWLVGEPTATLAAVEASAGVPVRLSVGGSSVGVEYRWDFGDGTPFATTSEPEVQHVYQASGVYRPRVELTDRMGRHAVVGG